MELVRAFARPALVALGVTLAAGPSLAGQSPGFLAQAARLAGIEVGAAIDSDLATWRQEILEREFTSATVENSLKWGMLSPSPGAYDFSRADAAVALAEQSGLRVRGHNLFWDRLNGAPAWLEDEVNAAPDSAAHLTQLMESHARTVVERYAGRIPQWDVVNEPLATLSGDLDPESLFSQTLGESYLDIAFAAARAADPKADLFLNETLAELVPGKFDGLVGLVARMLDRGAPLDGVGLQGHYFLGRPDRESLQAQLEEIASLGLIVELTEVDIAISLFASEEDPLAAQALAYADVFAACRAVPQCTGITTWGIDDGDTWLDTFSLTQGSAPNRPLLFDELGAPKPAYSAAVMALPEPRATLLAIAAFVAVTALQRWRARNAPGTARLRCASMSAARRCG